MIETQPAPTDATPRELSALDAEIAAIDANMARPDADRSTFDDQLAQRDTLFSKRAAIERKLNRVIGEPLGDDVVDSMIDKRAAFDADQRRIAANAHANATNRHSRADVSPIVDEPNLIPEGITSPHRYREYVDTLMRAQAGGGPAAEYARHVLGPMRSKLDAEAQERGLHVDPAVWLYEKQNPADSWPEIDANQWDAKVLEGKVDADAIPFADVALERGELCFVDWLRFIADHEHLADKVRPKLGSVLRAAEAKGLIVREGQQYRTTKTRKRVDIPNALRSEAGAVR